MIEEQILQAIADVCEDSTLCFQIIINDEDDREELALIDRAILEFDFKQCCFIRNQPNLSYSNSEVQI